MIEDDAALIGELREKAETWAPILVARPSYRDTARLIAVLRAAAAQLAAKDAEIARLRKLLLPFARFAEAVDSDPSARRTGDPCPLSLDYAKANDGTLVSIGDCRRALREVERVARGGGERKNKA